MTDIVFVVHSTTTDNEAGIASGHSDVSLSETGRCQAEALGARYKAKVDAVYCSDLRRAIETAEIAFGPDAFTVDLRLREQDYGERTGAPSAELEIERLQTVEEPFPGGESLRDCVVRVERFLADLEDSGRVLLIGHRATKLALDHILGGVSLDDAVSAPHVWQSGWRYEFGARATPS
jgi:alpha-ribazole phosphatase/probable phosphoglycerate mutase